MPLPPESERTLTPRNKDGKTPLLIPTEQLLAYVQIVLPCHILLAQSRNMR